MLSDIEIAQQATLLPVKEVAAQIGITEDELEFYGKYKAKLSDELSARVSANPDGKLILVTAINPTPAGEGKTTTTAGLGQAMAKIGRCRRRLRSGTPDGGHQPSLYRRYARDYLCEQPLLRHARQPYAAGQCSGHRPAQNPFQALS